MLFYSEDRPGKGVNPRNPNTPRIIVFFEILFRHFWGLCKLNILHMLASIPTFFITFFILGFFSQKIANSLFIAKDIFNMVLIEFIIRFALAFWFTVFLGQPATTGIVYVLRQFAREQHSYVFYDWRVQTTANIKQSLNIWIVDIFVICTLGISIVTYSKLENWMYYILFAIGSVGIIYVLARMYVYQIIVTFECKTSQVFKNAFIMMSLAKTLPLLFITIFIHIGIPCIGMLAGWHIISWVVFIGLEFICLPSITYFMINFFIYPQFEKLINNK